MAALMDELALTPTLDADAVETSITSGNVPPPGLHHAVLDGFREVQANSGTNGRELTFKIVAGPAKGMSVKETLWSPAGHDATKDERSRNRMRLFAHRLGLLRKVANADGKTHRFEAVAGKADFRDAFGAECVIDLVNEEREYDDPKTKQKKKINEAKLTFAGLLAVDDPKCKDVPRASAAQRQAVAPPPVAAATVDAFADL